jgi:hypothetical protein
MMATKVGNNTLDGNEIDLGVSRMECLYSVYFQQYDLMLPPCHLAIDVSHKANLLEPYWLFSVEISSSTPYGNETLK